jgi:hypothetical protein
LRFFALAIFFVAAIGGCAPAASSSQAQSAPVSAWGEIITITQAEQAEPPAMAALGRDQLMFAWIGADRAGVRQRMRRSNEGSLTNELTLTLPPLRPRQQSLYPAGGGNAHLLWIDEDEATRQLALYSALITPTDEIGRGPLPVSEGLSLQYTAARTGDGSLWVAWSGDPLSEPSLWMREIEVEGRPQLARRIALDAGYPAALTLGDDTMLLVWIDFASGQVMRGLFADGVLLESGAVTSTVALRDGDRLIDVRIAADASHGYLFWNISRADGHAEVWISSGALYGFNWSQPTQLSEAYRFAMPLTDQRATVQVAIAEDFGVGLLTMSGGGVARYERVVSNTRLIAAPALYTDDRRLYLAWAQPDPFAPAFLNVTSKEL